MERKKFLKQEMGHKKFLGERNEGQRNLHNRKIGHSKFLQDRNEA